MITDYKSTFSANDDRWKVWILHRHNILRPKREGNGIMMFDFYLPLSRLNLFSLLDEQQEEQVNLGIPREAANNFEYEKIEEGYWSGEHLFDQIINKALLYAENSDPGYELLFIFDKIISHSIYAKYTL